MENPNTIFTGDCLHVLCGTNSESVDLIYLDPPFNSKRMYSAPIGSKAAGAAFKDTWSWDDVDEAHLEGMVNKYPHLVTYIRSIEGIKGAPMMSYVTYMTQRIIEMHRVLKKTGSFYLHCDSTASHYLKIVLDKVFGEKNFRNEIIWQRITGGKVAKKNLPRNSDTIFRYTKTEDYQWEPITIKLNSTDVKTFNKNDNDGMGRYRLYSMQAPGINKNAMWGYVNKNGKTFYPSRNGWRVKMDKMKKLEDSGKLYFTDKGVHKKAYLSDSLKKGKALSNIWTDIPVLKGNERTGYPTQKPLKLLRRIIEASSNEGDVVLDPFCGCATTCVAADRLNRKWVGIDISEKAKELISERLKDDRGLFTDFVHRTDTPHRTDIKIEPVTVSTKKMLYLDQNGDCNGCSDYFDIRHFEIDHVVPKSKGGGDYYDNYQLLCGNCNRVKGNRPMEYLLAKIKARESGMMTFGGKYLAKRKI